MIRRRLTAVVIVLLAVVLSLLAVAVFLVTREAVLSEVERDVTNRAASLANAVGREPDAVADDYVGRFALPDIVAVVYGADGEVLARSATLVDRQVPFTPALFESGRVDELDASGPLVVSGAEVVLPGGDRGYVAIGRSPDRAYQALNTLARVLIPATLLALALIGGGVFYLLRRSLRPLEELGDEAAVIAATANHQARIGGDYRHDEVGSLAATVDSMLASLGEAHARARIASEALRDFLADASHELRAPLAIVTSSLDLLERSEQPDQALLGDARAEIERMARIVTQLLVMARTGEETRAADEPLLLGDLVDAICRRWDTSTELTIDASRVRSIDDVVVLANGDQLCQVFDVLLDNAIRYSPPGSRIDVSGAVDGSHVTIDVADSGVGISADELPYVFDRFHRGAGGGTGLGLAIARHIAEEHGGGIDASSIPGRGSRFSVRLPVLSLSQLSTTDEVVR